MMILGTWSSAFCAYRTQGRGPGILGGAIGGMVGGLIRGRDRLLRRRYIVSGVALIGLGIAKYLASRFFTSLPAGANPVAALPRPPDLSVPFSATRY